MPSAEWFPAFSPMKSVFRRNPTGITCWSIPSIPVRKNGTAEKYRQSCSPGDHAKVDAWRKKESYKRTMQRRPDMFAEFDESQLQTKADRKILREAKSEFSDSVSKE
jgi:hypothetical protein